MSEYLEGKKKSLQFKVACKKRLGFDKATLRITAVGCVSVSRQEIPDGGGAG